jgi:methyl-accepting chemotaxis protein
MEKTTKEMKKQMEGATQELQKGAEEASKEMEKATEGGTQEMKNAAEEAAKALEELQKQIEKAKEKSN